MHSEGRLTSTGLCLRKLLGEGEASLLTSTDVESSLSNDCPVILWHVLDVFLETAGMNDLLVEVFVEFVVGDDVVSSCA
jgi:hypothetical protein